MRTCTPHYAFAFLRSELLCLGPIPSLAVPPSAAISQPCEFLLTFCSPISKLARMPLSLLKQAAIIIITTKQLIFCNYTMIFQRNTATITDAEYNIPTLLLQKSHQTRIIQYELEKRLFHNKLSKKCSTRKSFQTQPKYLNLNFKQIAVCAVRMVL